ncbi:MAG: diguanylate cyclase [Candidatus Izemoplasmatales bacterium]
MEVLFRVQLNIMSAIVLFTMMFIGYKRLEKNDFLNKAFLFTSMIVGLELVLETISCLINNHDGPMDIILANMISVFLFALAPAISYLFVIFIELVVFPYREDKKRIKLYFMIPLFIQWIISLLSPIFGFYFYIDPHGVYVRGDLFYFSAALTYAYLLYGFFYVIKYRKNILKKDFWLLLAMGVIPMIGGLVQALIYGMLMMWSSAAFALLLAYVFLQERMVRLDYMTSTWTRESFYYAYSRRIQSNPKDPFSAIFFDVDDLKLINDQYGHDEGDKAICKIIEITRKAIPVKHNISRLGGDEFIISFEISDPEVLNKIYHEIEGALHQFNKSEQLPYTLKCSYGYDVYTDKFKDLDDYLRQLDHQMYEQKNHKIKTLKND